MRQIQTHREYAEGLAVLRHLAESAQADEEHDEEIVTFSLTSAV